MRHVLHVATQLVSMDPAFLHYWKTVTARPGSAETRKPPTRGRWGRDLNSGLIECTNAGCPAWIARHTNSNFENSCPKTFLLGTPSQLSNSVA